MRRLLAAAGIVAVDSALLTFAHPGAAHPELLPLWAMVVAGVLLLQRHHPAAAFVAALVPAGLLGWACALLPWCAYRMGRAGRGTTAMVVASSIGVVALGAGIALRPGAAQPRIVAAVVFGAVPLLAGRYLAQQERLAAALAAQERLRIARDMHDALGHRLSLVSVQAAALEVAGLPEEQRAAVRRLAESARGAARDLHEVVGALRAPRAGLAAVTELVERVRAAGVPVELAVRGEGREVPEAAFAVVREGLTNGVRHAPGAPLAVSLSWEGDSLLVAVANPVAAADRAAAADGPTGVAERAAAAGRVAADGGPTGVAEPAAAAGRVAADGGLTGVAERVELAGGLAGHGVADGEFRLWAVLPVAAAPPRRATLLGLAVAGLVFGFLPLSMLVGVA